MDNTTFRYDIKGLANDMEVELKSISKLYSEYFKEMKSNIIESNQFYKNKNWFKLERVVHNIKGISITLNIVDVYFVANKLDDKLKASNYDNISLELNNISELFNNTEKDIRGFFRQNDIQI